MLIVSFIIWSGVADWLTRVYHGNVLKLRPVGPWENAVIPSIFLSTTRPSVHSVRDVCFITPFFLLFFLVEHGFGVN